MSQCFLCHILIAFFPFSLHTFSCDIGIYIDRATTSSADDVDLLAINLFATIVQQNESMAYEATKIILRKFNSTNQDEVLLALNVVQFFLTYNNNKTHVLLK